MRKILTTLALLTTITGPAHSSVTFVGSQTATPPNGALEVAWASVSATIPNHTASPMLASPFVPRVAASKMDTGTDDFGYWRLSTPATKATYTATLAHSDGFGDAVIKPVLTGTATRVQSQAAGDYFAVTSSGESDSGDPTSGPDLYVHLTRNVPNSGYTMPAGEAHVTVVVTGFGA